MRQLRWRPSRLLLLAAGLLLAGGLVLAGLGDGQRPEPAEVDEAASAAVEHPRLALMGTIPIYWGEAADLTELIDGSAMPHWARAVIEARFSLVPLDYLSPEALAGHQRLLLAQPRGLAGEENVALDAFVRRGGRVLLFVDPLLTGHSRFAPGDRRRPQDVALLSPILAHWGLELQFDPRAGDGARTVMIGAARVPVEAPGRLVRRGPAGGCALLAQGLAADCAIGAGRVLILADAALLDLLDPPAEACPALAALLLAGFGENRAPVAEFGQQNIVSNDDLSSLRERCPVSDGGGHGH